MFEGYNWSCICSFFQNKSYVCDCWLILSAFLINVGHSRLLLGRPLHMALIKNIEKNSKFLSFTHSKQGLYKESAHSSDWLSRKVLMATSLNLIFRSKSDGVDHVCIKSKIILFLVFIIGTNQSFLIKISLLSFKDRHWNKDESYAFHCLMELNY